MESGQELQSGLHIGKDTGADLGEIGKWAGFLAITGFVVLALMIVFSFSLLFITGPLPAGASGQVLPTGLAFFLYIMIVVVYFFPTWFLFRFADGIRKALRKNDSNLFAASIRYLKTFFVYLGILMIIGIVVIVIVFMIGLSMGKLF